MYESYWKLSSRPFEEGPQSEFYVPLPGHQAALLKLRYLIEQRKGIGLLVGEHGLGKTFLTHVLEAQTLEAETLPFLRLVVPVLSATETLAYFAQRLGCPVENASRSDAILMRFESKLKELTADARSPVLIIDDAHLLDLEQLNLLRLMLNLRLPGSTDFSLILSGRTELLGKIRRVPALDQRIAVRAALQALAPEAVQQYITERLEVAQAGHLFSAESAQTLWELSQGVPRRINQLCDLGLLVGYADHLSSVTAVEIRAAAEELTSVC